MTRPRSLETFAFRGAVGALLVHAIDDAVLHRQPGEHALAALVALVGLAVAIPFVHRGTGAGTAARRWRNRALAVPATLLAAVFVVAPVAAAVVDSHKWREPIPSTPAGYEPVEFDATDGKRLRGWFHPSRNGASRSRPTGRSSPRSSPTGRPR